MPRSQVRIPSRDYDIDRSDSEMACHYSNSRAPGDMCHLLSYYIEPSLYDLLFLLCLLIGDYNLITITNIHD